MRDASHTELTILPFYGAEIEMACHGVRLNMRARGDLFMDPSQPTSPANPVDPVRKMAFDGIDPSRGQNSAPLREKKSKANTDKTDDMDEHGFEWPKTVPMNDSSAIGPNSIDGFLNGFRIFKSAFHPRKSVADIKRRRIVPFDKTKKLCGLGASAREYKQTCFFIAFEIASSLRSSQ